MNNEECQMILFLSFSLSLFVKKIYFAISLFPSLHLAISPSRHFAISPSRLIHSQLNLFFPVHPYLLSKSSLHFHYLFFFCLFCFIYLFNPFIRKVLEFFQLFLFLVFANFAILFVFFNQFIGIAPNITNSNSCFF